VSERDGRERRHPTVLTFGDFAIWGFWLSLREEGGSRWLEGGAAAAAVGAQQEEEEGKGPSVEVRQLAAAAGCACVEEEQEEEGGGAGLLLLQLVLQREVEKRRKKKRGGRRPAPCWLWVSTAEGRRRGGQRFCPSFHPKQGRFHLPCLP